MANDAKKIVMACGKVYSAKLGTPFPEFGEKPGDGWSDLGYIGDAGVAATINVSAQSIKEWSQSTVRKGVSDTEITASLPFLQIDYTTACRIFGEKNVAKDAETGVCTVNIGAHLPEEEEYLFDMTDGDRRFRIEVERGQITAPGSPSFVPNAATIFETTLTAFPGSDGECMRFVFDDKDDAAA